MCVHSVKQVSWYGCVNLLSCQVNVLPDDGLPVISDPVVAGCTDMVTGQCSFTYSRDATPELLRVEVSRVKGHFPTNRLCICEHMVSSTAKSGKLGLKLQLQYTHCSHTYLHIMLFVLEAMKNLGYVAPQYHKTLEVPSFQGWIYIENMCLGDF